MGALRDEIFGAIREDYRKYGKYSFLYKYLRNGKLKDKCDKDPGNEEKFVHKAATDLMYNYGFPLAVKTGKSTYDVFAFSSEEIQKKEKKREQNRKYRENKKRENGQAGKSYGSGPAKVRNSNAELDLMDAWYETYGQTKAAMMDDDTIDAYQKLYEALNAAGRRNAFIPIVTDPMTGTGVYIVGRDLYASDEDFIYGENYACGIRVIGNWDYDPEVGIGLYMSDPDTDFRTPSMNYPSVREAMNWYRSAFLSDPMDSIREWNRDMPDGAPKQFTTYFQNAEGDAAFERIDESERNEVMSSFSLSLGNQK